VRFYKDAISRVFLGKNFKKPLAFFALKWYVVSNKSETWIHLLSERLLRLCTRFCSYLAIFFIYLLIIYPACPARDEKSDDPPARVIAFSFVGRLPDCSAGLTSCACLSSLFLPLAAVVAVAQGLSLLRCAQQTRSPPKPC
jgi:hypothetical protein